MELNKLVKEKVIILDGATGTTLQKKGMESGVCPESWALENPQALMDIQREYVSAGSDIIYTFTFGANPIKLEEYGLRDKAYEMNRDLVKLSKKAADGKAYVAGNLAPTGQYIRPVGELDFEEVVNSYKEQVRGLIDGGVDLFVIETMMDIQESRAALLAVKESSSLPVMISMTFEPNGRTLTGTDPVTALITLQSMGADVVGCNCSAGPDAMIAIIKKMAPYAKIPLLAKPNAGLPELINGETCFSMDQYEFSSYAKALIEAGASLLGGCCGTTPEYIKVLKERVKDLAPKSIKNEMRSLLTSSTRYVEIGYDKPLTVVGERINPTGKKELQKELLAGNMNLLQQFAFEQKEKGASVLDVNVGMNGVDEGATMLKAMELLSVTVDLPLCIDSSDPEVIEKALRVYPGRALINSVSYEDKKMDILFKAAAKYGSMVIILPLSENGLPKDVEHKHSLIEKIYERGQMEGLTKADVVVDGLVMTVSSKQSAVMDTLKTIHWCRHEFGTNTIIGLSNVSFGLPERNYINGAFLAIAMGKGLTMAIANPSHQLLMHLKMAADVLMGNDENCRAYIKNFNRDKGNIGTENTQQKHEEENLSKHIFNTVLKGKQKNIEALLKQALDEGYKASAIVDEILIPAINEVGDLFDKGIYFLPQLILSAETMKKGFNLLEPLLLEQTKTKEEKPKIILATVKGDIHDIGKNIVGLMMKNYGFHVIDLGKDVGAERIIKAIKEHHVALVGLSALMTTTMVQMKDVIDLIKKEKLNVKVMIGGAVITQAYADEIGADGYSKDANDAVRLAKRLINR